MAFLNQFASYFNSQEQETELYALWSSIGVNTEKAFLEEQNKINAEFTDINNFSEDTMRSWLAFFLQKIPYRTTATTQVTVTPAGKYEEINISQYDELTTDNGIIYTLMESITLNGDDKRTVTAVQGHRIVETGTYSSIIKIQANNPDLSYLNVKLNGVEIPEVSYETSYDQLTYLGSWKPVNMEGNKYGGEPFLQNKYGTKGNFYTVIADGTVKFGETDLSIEFKTGDLVVYDGEKWQRSAYTNKLNPIQFTNSYAVPKNGYFAYFYNDYLYIKIFSGSEITTPNGQAYEVSYIQSDGVQGEIEANTLKFVSTYEDSDENKVTLEVTNTKSTVAVNEPSVGKLGLYLKQRLYSSINVSSIPEYTAWFNAQPEVGDCLVLSDYERYIRGGKQELEVTGIVDVFLVDINGNPLEDNVKEELLERIEPYKDIAVLQISDFTEVLHYIVFEYTTSTSQNAFEQFCQSKASQYYNLAYLQSKDSSLFNDLDLAALLQDIQENSPYASTGLICKGYHYQKIEVDGRSKAISTNSYAGERCGSGYYIFTTDDGTVHKLEEVGAVGVSNSAAIYDVDVGNVSIGNHNETVVTIDLSGYEFETGILECFWGMENEGILTIGVDNGLRKLYAVEVKKVE